jgi:hypothetical protein
LRSTITTLVFGLLFSALAPWAPAGDPPSDGKDVVVITIGPRKITAAEFEKKIDLLPPQHKAFYKGAGKRQFANELVRLDLLVGEAIRRKLDENPDIKEQLELARSNILAAAALRALESGIGASDVEVEKFYNEHKREFEEIRTRHILIRGASSILPAESGAKVLTDVEAKAKAEDLRKQILQGADFAQLAQKNSDDPTTAPQGGDMGFLKRGKQVPPFEAAAFALEPGQVSEVVSTPFGFHIIKVEARKTLADQREAVAARVRQAKVSEKVSDLVKQLNPIINESYFHSDHPGEAIPAWNVPARSKTGAGAPPPEKKP